MTGMTLLVLAAAYVVGSIPTGLWLGLAVHGVDIRQHGSRNIGATNTLRILGKKLGVLAFLGDTGKGAVAVLLIAPFSTWPYAALACGLAAIIGHMASIFIRFQGGKGVATSAGVFLALAPIPTLAALGVFLLVVAATRMVSAGSCLAAITLAAAVLMMPHSWVAAPAHQIPDTAVFRGIVVALGVFVVFRHRANLIRIVRGQEHRLGSR